MSRSKYFSFFICASLLTLGGTAYADMPCNDFTHDPTIAVELPTLHELSGFVVSRSNPKYLWVHTDSQTDSELFVMNRQGQVVHTYKLDHINNIDWEDIAIGPCKPWSEENCIYLADIGDNLFIRDNKRIHSIKEPQLPDDLSLSDEDEYLEVISTWTIKYPVTTGASKYRNPDAESLMVHPYSGDVYLITKQSSGGKQSLYQMTRGGSDAGKLTLLGYYEFESLQGAIFKLYDAVTAADFAPNGQRFAVRTYSTIYEYDLAAYGSMAQAFQNPVERFISDEAQGEALAYDVDGKSLITGGEQMEGTPIAPLNFYTCNPNPDYVEPDPIVIPDQLPEYEEEPGPAYDPDPIPEEPEPEDPEDPEDPGQQGADPDDLPIRDITPSNPSTPAIPTDPKTPSENNNHPATPGQETPDQSTPGQETPDQSTPGQETPDQSATDQPTPTVPDNIPYISPNVAKKPTDDCSATPFSSQSGHYWYLLALVTGGGLLLRRRKGLIK